MGISLPDMRGGRRRRRYGFSTFCFSTYHNTFLKVLDISIMVSHFSSSGTLFFLFLFVYTEEIRDLSGIRDPKLGIGKQKEDDYFTSEENIQQRKLDIELEEADENTKKRKRSRKYARNLKQYKLAMEFEAHLSSYNHNCRKRFKEMREMHGMSSRDDRQKQEQQREEREMAKFAQIVDARKQYEESGSAPAAPASTETKISSILADKEQIKALKFGFSSKGGTSKVHLPNLNLIRWCCKEAKTKVPVASIFSNDSDEEK
ncbi:hypothetical protein UlMin_015139 [Ulmus minor]